MDAADTYDDDAFRAVLVAAPAMTHDADRAIALAAGRRAARIDWDAVPIEIGRQSGHPVLVVEADGVDDDTLATALPRIDAVATALDLHVVASFGPRAIDIVAAHLLGPRTVLLCAPTLAERVAALAIAGRMGRETMLHGHVHEDDGKRLKRLNEEVARIAATLVALTGQDTVSTDPADTVADRRGGYGAGPPRRKGAVDGHAIRQLIRARRLRDQFFGEALFEDPAWDMILDLYAAALEDTRVSVSSLCIAAAVAPTTALRWIAKMTDAGLFERRPDPVDRRRAYMGLTPAAIAGMHAYVDAAARQGLPLA